MQTNWEEGLLKITDGIELFYVRTGGEKPKLILLHGITDSGSCWFQLANDLEANYDVIMYDAYGHGKSSRIDTAKRFDMVEDLHDLITALKLDKPGIMGHSMGAATAAAFAAKYPEKLSLLVLEDPPWANFKFDQTVAKATLQDWKKKNLSAKEKTVKDLIRLKKIESPNWEESVLQEWALAKIEVDPAIFDYYPIQEGEWQNLAKAIIVPTLIITGDNELGALVTPKIGIEAVKLLRKGEFGHISRAGHCVRYEQYQPYLIMLRLFLKRNFPD